MKKILASLFVAIAMLSAGCALTPAQKEYVDFEKHCKVQPTAKDCLEYKANASGGGNSDSAQ